MNGREGKDDKMRNFSKVRNFFLIIISIALIITSKQLYDIKKENKIKYELFLNHFYFSLGYTLDSLDSVLKEPREGIELERALRRVEQELEQTTLLLNTGNYFVNRNISGLGSIFENHPIGQFADDNKLSNEEVRYLGNLKKDMEFIKTGISSDETGQENPNISIRALNDIIRGSGLKPGFLTEHKSVAVPFEVIDLQKAPEPIQRWVEENKSSEQSKVFLVDEKTYVLIFPDREEAGTKQVTITNMVRKGSSISVSHEIEKLSKKEDGVERGSEIGIAELEFEMERSFGFTKQSANESRHEESTTRGNSVQLYVSGEAVIELILPERLSKDGQVKEFNE